MSGTRRHEDRVLFSTLERLTALYKENHIQPGQMVRAGIKPYWIMIAGSEQECGISRNGTSMSPDGNVPPRSPPVTRIRAMINRPLFEIAATGIQAEDPLERSLGIAAISALSQKFLSCVAIRKRGYLSHCWRTVDPFILQYPVLSRFITMDDIVFAIGNGAQVRDLRGMCRELHVVDPNPPEISRTILIGSAAECSPFHIVRHDGTMDPDLLDTADVVFFDASSLIDGTFGRMIPHTGNARLVGLCGPGCSLIPDAFFDQGLNFISSFRITDPCAFIDVMTSETDVENSLKTGQKQYLMMHPSAAAGKDRRRRFVTGT